MEGAEPYNTGFPSSAVILALFGYFYTLYHHDVVKFVSFIYSKFIISCLALQAIIAEILTTLGPSETSYSLNKAQYPNTKS